MGYLYIPAINGFSSPRGLRDALVTPALVWLFVQMSHITCLRDVSEETGRLKHKQIAATSGGFTDSSDTPPTLVYLQVPQHRRFLHISRLGTSPFCLSVSWRLVLGQSLCSVSHRLPETNVGTRVHRLAALTRDRRNV